MRARARAALALALPAALGAWPIYATLRAHGRDAAARGELARQAGEGAECRARLRRFHAAWAAYRADHGGREPPGVPALFPAYLRDGMELLCPTAERWRRAGRTLGQGRVALGRRSFAASYGFRWLAAGRARPAPDAPLVVCEAHAEAAYRAAFDSAPPLGAFDPGPRALLPPAVRAAPRPAVRRDGTLTDGR